MTVTPHNRMLRLRLDSATNQLQLPQTAANQGEMQKFTRIEFPSRNCPTCYTTRVESSRFKEQLTEGSGQLAVKTSLSLLPTAHCFPIHCYFSLLSCE